MKRKLISLVLAVLMLTGLMAAPAMADGCWKKDSTGWWYDLGGGDYLAGEWARINGIWYYFNPNGYMRTGWLLDDGVWYYLLPSGAMAMGWQKVGGTWYYMNGSGAMVANDWVKSGSDWYYMGPDGAMVTDAWLDGDYVDENGIWYDTDHITIYSANEIRKADGGWMVYAEFEEDYYYTDDDITSLQIGDTVAPLNVRVDYLERDGDWLHISDNGPYYSFMRNPLTGSWTLRGDNDEAASRIVQTDWFFIPETAELIDEMWLGTFGIQAEISEPGDFFLIPGQTWKAHAANLVAFSRGGTVEKVVQYYAP